MGKEGKGGAYGKAIKDIPTEGTGTPYKEKSTGRRKKVENKGGGGGARGQATRSAARMKEKLNRGAKEESRRALWQRDARRSMVARIGVVYCNNRLHFIQVFTIMQPHGPLLCFISLHISNGSVSASLVGHVLYSADLMSAICIPHSLLMVHRYIYSRYSPVFLMLYQLYHSLSSSTLNTSLSLYLSVAT